MIAWEHLGVRALLGKERKDGSGDVTLGADLDESQINDVMMMFELNPQSNSNFKDLPEWSGTTRVLFPSNLTTELGQLVRRSFR